MILDSFPWVQGGGRERVAASFQGVDRPVPQVRSPRPPHQPSWKLGGGGAEAGLPVSPKAA